MDLYNDADAPAIDRGVLLRLKRLDPRLRVTFSKYAIDYTNGGRPVEIRNWDYETVPEGHEKLHKRSGAVYLLDPAFHLWSQGGDGKWRHVQAYTAQNGFGHREVQRLEGDVTRRFTISQILDRMEKAREAQKEAARRRWKDNRYDTIHANERRISDLMNGKFGVRQAKISSYAGQTSRSTPGDIRMDDKEDGWERPDQ